VSLQNRFIYLRTLLSIANGSIIKAEFEFQPARRTHSTVWRSIRRRLGTGLELVLPSPGAHYRSFACGSAIRGRTERRRSSSRPPLPCRQSRSTNFRFITISTVVMAETSRSGFFSRMRCYVQHRVVHPSPGNISCHPAYIVAVTLLRISTAKNLPTLKLQGYSGATILHRHSPYIHLI